jgi:hypothetical protein
METYINTTNYLEYGILIAIVLSAAELVCIAAMNGSKKLNPLSYIIAVALCAILSFQMSRLISACSVSSAVNDAQTIVSLVSPTAANVVCEATKVSTKGIGWFIFRRCLWSVLFMGVAGFVMYITMLPKSKRSYESADDLFESSQSTDDWGF